MKKIFTLSALLLITFGVFAQAPQKLSYQAVIRDALNNLVPNHAVGMRITILQGSASGVAVYSETQTPATNANGLVSIEIGGGAGFSSINWEAGPYFLKTETDPLGGTSYTIVGTSQLLSVPYALHAQAAATANYNTLSNLPALNISNWNTAYSWGDHAGLYRPVSWVPSWSDITSKPSFATIATSGNYNDLINKPTIPASLWLTNGTSIYYNTGSVGIGTDSPVGFLTIAKDSWTILPQLLLTETANDFARLAFSNTIVPLKNWTIAGYTSTTDANSVLNFWYSPDAITGTNIMSITGNGNVGIGDQTPDATLDVEGTIVFGSAGKVFSEIREITGTLTTGGSYSFIYPSGYTLTNTRVLSLEINFNGNQWMGISGTDYPLVDISKIYYRLDNFIWIYYPDVSSFQNRAFRMMVMKVE
jgi:hypothetical protein